MLQNKDEHAINMYLYQYYETLYEFNDSTSSPPMWNHLMSGWRARTWSMSSSTIGTDPKKVKPMQILVKCGETSE